MSEVSDLQLLNEYAETNSEAAFAALVSRYVNLVYSVALRKTGNAHAAQEVTQAVFIILARKARRLGASTVLSGWLYQTARLTAANYVRAENRRVRREQEAFMQSHSNQSESSVWSQIAPLLEDAVGRLGDKDRNAIVLRFFNGQSMAEVGAALGVSEDAAKMRVNRAVEKLRMFLRRRGVVTSASAMVGAVLANSVQTAPEGVAATVAAAAGKGSAPAASALALADGTVRVMTWLKLKTVGAVVVGLLIGVTPVVIAEMRNPALVSDHDSSNDALLIVPGVSVGKVRAGMTVQQVMAELGQPDRKTGRRLHYVRQGFSVLPRDDSDAVLAIFCGDTLGIDGPMAKAFKGRTKEGIGMGSNRADIIRAFGEPNEDQNLQPNQELLKYTGLKMSLGLNRGKVVHINIEF
jgi:RNA polymerase sigma factor (sigma-70 family)